VALATALVGGLGLAAPAAPAVADDSQLPEFGTAAYDVQHYDIDLTWRPAKRAIRAVATIEATTAGPATTVTFDLAGLSVESVTVDGTPATFTRSGHKLTVTPDHTVAGAFSTVVTYSGKPKAFEDSGGLSVDGWIRTGRGATVLSEPVGAATWFPNNDTPSDKATFDVSVTVGRNVEVAGSGDLVSHRRTGSTRTWRWVQTRPMATYLAMISIGQYRVYHSTMKTLAGATLPVWTFIDTRLGSLKHQRKALPKLIRFAEARFGPYPQTSAGMVVTSMDTGYSLETQNRPVFTWIPDDMVLLHELAHQWFGDSVTPSDWGDIWLNEGFATYAEWLLLDHRHLVDADLIFDIYYDEENRWLDWSLPPADLPDSDALFNYGAVYVRGALTLQALRERIGDSDFFALLPRSTAERAGHNATTADFIALAEEVSGEELSPLFQDWLYTASRPTGY
jgi:aminopeptidase N